MTLRDTLLTLCAVASELGGCFVFLFRRQKVFQDVSGITKARCVRPSRICTSLFFFSDLNNITALNQQKHKSSPRVFKLRSAKAYRCFLNIGVKAC